MEPTPATAMSPEEISAHRADAKLPYECKVCHSKLNASSIFRISRTHNTGELNRVQAKLPPGGEFTERGANQIYCAPCCDAQIRLKRANEGTRPLPSERNGPAISALTGLTGKQAALAKARALKAARAEAAKSLVWEMTSHGVFQANGMSIAKTVDEKWRLNVGKLSIVLGTLQNAFETAEELRHGNG